jgi:hypothetical protein
MTPRRPMVFSLKEHETRCGLTIIQVWTFLFAGNIRALFINNVFQ